MNTKSIFQKGDRIKSCLNQSIVEMKDFTATIIEVEIRNDRECYLVLRDDHKDFHGGLWNIIVTPKNKSSIQLIQTLEWDK